MKKIISLSFALSLSAILLAEGYQVNMQSTRQTGMGHVGTALKLGSESVHFNPAGLGFMNGKIDVSLGASAIFSKAEYTNGGYNATTDNSASTPIFGYAGFRIYDNLKFGFGITTPYGSSMNWGKTWKGGHLVQDISLKAFVFQPTLAYKIGEKISLGGGLMIAKGSVEISRSILPVGSLAPILGEAYKDVVPVAATLTGKSDIALGYNIGAMVDITEKLTLGVSYRSKMRMKVAEGEAELIYANDAIKQFLNSQNPPKVPPLDQGTFKSELPLPSNINVGISFKPSDKFLLSVDVQGVGWQAYDKLSLKFTQNVLNGYSIEADKKYEFAYAIRLGGQYAVTERLEVRTGVYMDTTPVQSDYYNPETPGMTKWGLSAGLSFRPIKNLSIDAAFLAILGEGADGSYTYISSMTGQPETFSGSYKSNAFAPSLGVSYHF